jgi:hypothetical protein
MKPSRYVAVFALINALTFGLTYSLVEAGQGNRSHRGGQTNSHKSGNANGNAQWAADPERGWVRANERQEPNEATGKAKQDRTKHKAKGAKEKPHD